MSNKIVKKVAVIGAGHGGITTAVDLKKRGFEVVLYTLPDKFKKVNQINQKEIIIQEKNKQTYVDSIEVSSNPEETIQGADVIIYTLPGIALAKYAQITAPFIKEDQLILFNLSSCFASILFNKAIEHMDLDTNFFFAEANSLPYATRAYPEKSLIELSLRVKKLFLSAYPKERTEEALSLAKQVYNTYVPAKDVLHIFLLNANPEVHPAPAILNTGRIDYSKGDFYLYKEGITENTVKLMKKIAEERRQIAKAYGYQLEGPLESRFANGYFAYEPDKSLQELFNTSPVFRDIKGPESVKSRYFEEDIAIGLNLWEQLGEIVGLKVKHISALITIGSALAGIDYRHGISLKELGFEPERGKEGILEKL